MFLDLRSRFASRPIRKPPKYDIVLCVMVEAQITVREQYGFRLCLVWNARTATSTEGSAQLDSTTPQPGIRCLADGFWNYDSPMVSGTATVRWFLEIRQSDGLWNCHSSWSMFSIVLEK